MTVYHKTQTSVKQRPASIKYKIDKKTKKIRQDSKKICMQGERFY